MTDNPLSTHPILLFDGVCNLCQRAVQEVIQRDPEAKVRFASLQSAAARQALLEQNVTPENLPDSLVLIDHRGVHTHSTAALRVARVLGFPTSLLAVFLVIPKPLRDIAYKWVARNRYRWFGKQDVCWLPSPELEKHFLGSVSAVDNDQEGRTKTEERRSNGPYS